VSAWAIDQARVDRVTRFVASLRQSKGEWAGQRIALMPWQCDLLRDLYGTVDATGARRYRSAFCLVGRKSGKTTIAAALALYHLVADGEAGAEVILAAVDRDQASIAYQIAVDMAEANAGLAGMLTVLPSSKRIVYGATKSVLRVIASDAAGAHGLNASAVIADEVHAWGAGGDALWDALATATAARRNPMMLAITTAGTDLDASLGGRLYTHALRVRDGIADDPRLLPVIWGAPPDAPWDDPATWQAHHPGYGVTVSHDWLAGEAARAKAMPSLEGAFRRLMLGQWTRQTTRWMPMAAFEACTGTLSVADLETDCEGLACWGGLDLSATQDLTAFTLIFPRIDGTYAVICRAWLPEHDIEGRTRRDRVPYDAWARMGLLTLCPGNVIDYDIVRRDINALRERFDIRGISYDRWNSGGIWAGLTADGFDVAPVSQNMAGLGPMTKEWGRLMVAGHFRHGGHPILRWQVDGLAVDQDAAGNVRPSKAKARCRIDLVVASIMALDGAQRAIASGRSVYEERGLLLI
jgi:phage terminase large subunit-like protein